MTDIVGPAGRQEKWVERRGCREDQKAHRTFGFVSMTGEVECTGDLGVGDVL